MNRFAKAKYFSRGPCKAERTSNSIYPRVICFISFCKKLCPLLLLSLEREPEAHWPRQPLKKVTRSDDLAVPFGRCGLSILEFSGTCAWGKDCYIAFWGPLLRMRAEKRLLGRRAVTGLGAAIALVRALSLHLWSMLGQEKSAPRKWIDVMPGCLPIYFSGRHLNLETLCPLQILQVIPQHFSTGRWGWPCCLSPGMCLFGFIIP